MLQEFIELDPSTNMSHGYVIEQDKAWSNFNGFRFYIQALLSSEEHLYRLSQALWLKNSRIGCKLYLVHIARFSEVKLFTM